MENDSFINTETCSYLLRASLLIVSWMKDILIQMKASPLATFTHKVSTIYNLFEDHFKLFF